MNFTKLVLRDICVSGRGAKSATCGQENGEKVTFNLSKDPVYSPFGANSFGDEQQSRRTIEWTLNAEQLQFWSKFDEWAIKYIQKNAERLFKKVMTIEQVKDAYKSPVSIKENGQYSPHLRTKINFAGPNVTKFWDEKNEKIEMITEV